jgi:hypothetical protein
MDRAGEVLGVRILIFWFFCAQVLNIRTLNCKPAEGRLAKYSGPININGLVE